MRTGASGPTDIRLYLANNYLTSAGLPNQLFEIHNLTSLYLRSNKFVELPHAIGQLKNLKDLNVAMNKLKYLPAELLQLKLDSLRTSPNPFLKYAGTKQKKDQEDDSTLHHCSLRKHNFKFPSLVELASRILLEPVPTSTMSRPKSYSPSESSNGFVRRHFHNVRDEAISPRTDSVPLPPHLLKPFLPLLQPLPHHLHALLRDEGSLCPQSNDLQYCSVCKQACVNFAEERLEWKYEIAGQKIADKDHQEQWIPIMWRGCNANCLDFLET